MPICFKLFRHCVRAAAARTFCTAGTSRAIKIAIIAMTTSSSISVNALWLDLSMADSSTWSQGDLPLPRRLVRHESRLVRRRKATDAAARLLTIHNDSNQVLTIPQQDSGFFLEVNGIGSIRKNARSFSARNRHGVWYSRRKSL